MCADLQDTVAASLLHLQSRYTNVEVYEGKAGADADLSLVAFCRANPDTVGALVSNDNDLILMDHQCPVVELAINDRGHGGAEAYSVWVKSTVHPAYAAACKGPLTRIADQTIASWQKACKGRGSEAPAHFCAGKNGWLSRAPSGKQCRRPPQHQPQPQQTKYPPPPHTHKRCNTHRLYVYVCVYTCTYTHVYTYTCIYVAYMLRKQAYTYTHICTYTHTRVHIRAYT